MIPKFRAWGKEGKLYQDEEVSIVRGQFVKSSYAAAWWMKEAELFNVQQSTGLKGYMDESYEDPQEKDVYRGDIIDIFWEEWPMGYYQENHIIGVVDTDETGTAWIIKDAKYDFDTPKPIPSEVDGISVSMSLPDAEDLEEIFLHNFNLTSSDITILGNIYENPELLDQSNES